MMEATAMESSSQTSIQLGQVLAGKFRVERVLGTGGMGVVVLAEHIHLHQHVALKLLLPEMLQQPDIVARFKREARATARLKNDHVARILDVGDLEGGVPYIVMEYLEGCDLGDLLAGGMPRLEDAVHYVLQACEALAEAHRCGIIHRDLKPKNLFLTRSVGGAPLIKVLDFGVSRFAETGNVDVYLTRTTSVVGSPVYMAPEQMRAARNADERSDIWALGVILYELLTGVVPFDGESMTDLFAKIVAALPPAPHVLRPEISPKLSAVVMRCLSVEATRRPANVAELSLELAAFGPFEGRAVSDRILKITGATRPSVAEPSVVEASVTAVSASSDAVLRAATVRTLATELPNRRRQMVLAGAGVALVATLGVVGILASGRKSEGRVNDVAADPTLPASTTVVAAASSSSDLPPMAPVAPAATPLTPTTAVDAGAPVVSRPASTASMGTKPPPVQKPSPSGRPMARSPAKAPKDDPFQNRTSF